MRNVCLKARFFGVVLVTSLTACAPTLKTDGALAVQFDSGSYETAIAAMADYRAADGRVGLRPGDLVRVNIAEVPELNTESRILPNGDIALPYVGSMNVTGKPIGDLQNEIQAKLGAFVVEPVVTVSVVEFADPFSKPKIYIMGNVNKPGAYTYDEPVTVLEALALCGGTDFGSDLNAIVTIRREGGVMVATISRTNDLLHRGIAKGKVAYLMPQDIVYVPRSSLTRTADIMEEVRRVIGFSGFSSSISYRFDELD